MSVRRQPECHFCGKRQDREILLAKHGIVWTCEPCRAEWLSKQPEPRKEWSAK